MTPADQLVDRLDGYRPGGDHLPRWLARSVSKVSFWGAIALPLVYLSLLVAGIDDPEGLFVFLGLVALHVVLLVVGRSYRSDTAR